MPKYLIQDVVLGKISVVRDSALPFFPNSIILDVLDDEDPAPIYYTGGEADFRYVNVAELDDPASPGYIGVQVAAVAAIEAEETVEPVGLWDFTQAPRVNGTPISTRTDESIRTAVGVAVVVHGDNPNLPRPSTSLPVIWYGTASPANANDTTDVYVPVVEEV